MVAQGYRGMMVTRAAFLLLLATTVAGCDPFEETGKRPWKPHAWSKSKSNHEFWWTDYTTRRDCMEAMAYALNNPPNNEWYSAPYGCAYHSTSYWKVWIATTIYGGPYQCIVRTITESAKVEPMYGPLLEGGARRGQGYYCV